MCKNVWDLVCLVRSSTDNWKTTLWKNINVEQMDVDSKRFSKVRNAVLQVIIGLS